MEQKQRCDTAWVAEADRDFDPDVWVDGLASMATIFADAA